MQDFVRGGVAAAALALAGSAVWAAGSDDHSHDHEHADSAAMVEQMRQLHAGHDHEHDFELLASLSETDMHGTVDTLIELGLALPPMDGDRGRELFMAKGCIVCHQVNGVGGDIGPSLNAADMPHAMNAFEFAARMWRGAPSMAMMQEDLLGGLIDLTGQELADIVAFAHDEVAQAKVTAEDVPEPFRDLIP